MSLFTWLKNRFGVRGKALSLYKRGMRRARNRDHKGAIDHYTTAINMPGAPPDVKAMAQYNRALIYLATKHNAKAIEDLNLVLAMTETLTNIKTMARQKLIRIERRSLEHEQRKIVG